MTRTFRLQPKPALLVVDDDAGANYETYLPPMLNPLGIPYARWTVATQSSPAAHVSALCAAAVLFTGDDAVNSLTRAEQNTLLSYLNGGGRLFVTGQNIGMDIKNDNGAFLPRCPPRHVHPGQRRGDRNRRPGVLQRADRRACRGSGADNQTSPDVIAPHDAAATPVFTYTTGAAGLAVDDGVRFVYLSRVWAGGRCRQRATGDDPTGGPGVAGAWSQPLARLELTVMPQPPRVWLGIPVTPYPTLLNDSLLPMTGGVLTLTLPSRRRC